VSIRIARINLGVVVIAVVASIQGMHAALPLSASTQGYDKRTILPPDPQVSAERDLAAAQLQARFPDVRIDYDPVSGSPIWICRIGFLSKTPEEEVKRTGDLGLGPDDPHWAIKAFLIENEALFGYGTEALADALVEREFVTEYNGMRTTIWQQQLDGIAVFGARFKGHIARSGRLVNVSSRFLVNIEQASGQDQPNRVLLESSPPISAAQALANAMADLGETVQPDSLIPVNAASSGPEKRQSFTAAGLLGEGRVKLAWLPMNHSSLRLCWLVEFINRSTMEGLRTLVDAVSGETVVRQNRTSRYSSASYRVFTSDSPSPFTPGFDTPSSAQPSVVACQLLTLPALSQTASPAGWISDGDNETLGNNVDASPYRLAPNGSPASRPQGSPSRVFDFAPDLNNDPVYYQDAATVSLFYWCNWMHDKLYALGFTEAAGNYQQDNFGRGGLGGDRMLAYAQFAADTGHRNSSEFVAAPDGTSGIIAMYVWDWMYPSRDADLDAQMIAHEYTHGLSDRLVDIIVADDSRQDTALSEGWSDFYALSLLSETSDNVNGNYPYAGYVTYNYNWFTENYYYRMRRYPYSVAMNNNPLTFKDIDPSQADPHSGIPTSACSIIVPYAAEVHNMGEVWCVTLWDARANLIAQHGASYGNNLMLQLVTDGMKLCPPTPNFTQARDAILQADVVDNCGLDGIWLWTAFAKRGMGWSAVAPAAYTSIGVEEWFDMPPTLSACDD